MVKSCCAYNCKSRYNGNPNIRFHGFPLKSPELLSKWISAVKRKDFIPKSYSYLCSLHFKPEDYYPSLVSGNPMLKKDAVPSIFSFSEHLVKAEKQSRRIIQCDAVMNEPVIDELVIEEVITSNDQAVLTDSYDTKDVAVQTDLTTKKLDSVLHNLRRDKKVLQMKILRRDSLVKKLQNAGHEDQEGHVSPESETDNNIDHAS